MATAPLPVPTPAAAPAAPTTPTPAPASVGASSTTTPLAGESSSAFASPEEKEQLVAKSKDEAQLTKKQRRLIRNRLSAQLHRERKKAHLEKLERDVKSLADENEKLKSQVKVLMAENSKLRHQVNSTKTRLMETEEMLSGDVGVEVDASLGILEDLAGSEPGSPFFDDSSAADTLDSYVSRPAYAVSPDNSDDELGLGDMDMDMGIDIAGVESEILDLADGLEGLEGIDDDAAFAALTDTVPNPEPVSVTPLAKLGRWMSSGVASPMFVEANSKKRKGSASSSRAKRAKGAVALAGFVMCFAFFGGGVDLGITSSTSPVKLGELPESAVTLNFNDAADSILPPGMKVVGEGQGLMVGDIEDVDLGLESAESQKARRRLMSLKPNEQDIKDTATAANALALINQEISESDSSQFTLAVWNEIRNLMGMAGSGGGVFAAHDRTAHQIFQSLPDEAKKRAILSALRAFVLHKSSSTVDIAKSMNVQNDRNASMIVCPEAHGYFDRGSPRRSGLRSRSSEDNATFKMWIPSDSVREFGDHAQSAGRVGFYELGCKLERFHPYVAGVNSDAAVKIVPASPIA